ncbi:MULTISPECIES: glycosyltransferase family 9 protein [Pseudanabaena]|uniref:Glycosyl transferase family 9 n=2 Tax=Pseudanabaena TaxID=1152 RepID=L8N5Y3_9CYAN|nr:MULTISPECIES: glycosyltransferase family 9 protein [Pseudanabaena]ELS34544.1 glycosyl transferase family 9 [Pseudanabaena biceps PCC 7429]MDG3493229.1 glycosyltransferase family 9 protein [Pseudanabaena catenata USMAC16]
MMRILALVPGGTGDQLLFFPTLDTLKQQYPNAEIDVVVEPRAMAAYRVCQSVNRVLKFDFKDRNSLADFGNLLGTIRDREYDAAIVTQPNLSMNVLLWLSGIPKRISFKGQGDFLLTDIIAMDPQEYTAVQNHNLLMAVNIQKHCPPIKVNLPKNDLDWSTNEQKRLGIQQSGFILLNCGAYANYPAASWATIAKDLQAKQPNLPIVAIDSVNNAALLKQLTTLVPNLLITSPTDIGKLTAFIASANLFICAEGDAMQLGVAVGTALVAILGANTPAGKSLPIAEKRIKYVQASAGQSLKAVDPLIVLETIWAG